MLVVLFKYKDKHYYTIMDKFLLLISSREGQAKKTNILKLDMSGRFAINVVDNLVVVHHQSSKVIYLPSAIARQC